MLDYRYWFLIGWVQLQLSQILNVPALYMQVDNPQRTAEPNTHSFTQTPLRVITRNLD